MSVTIDRGTPAPQGPIIADRHLYLDSTGTRVVEHGDVASATQFAAQGHPISQEDADRLGLTFKDGKVVQDHPAKLEDLRAAHDDVQSEHDAFLKEIDAYKKENAVKDIPNTMEAKRVRLEAKLEQSRLTLAQSIKTAAGKDPFKGESQATSTRPDADKATAVKPAAKPSDAAAAAKAAGSTPPGT